MKGPALFGAALGVALLIAGIVLLSQRGPNVLGTSGVAPTVFGNVLRDGEALCMDQQRVPPQADTALVVLGIDAGTRGTVVLEGRAGGATVVRGSAPVTSGVTRIPLRRSGTTADGLRLCVRHEGAGLLSIAGQGASNATFESGTRRLPAPLVSVVYPFPGDHASWLDEADDIADRFDHVRVAPLGTATMWLALLAALAAVAVGVLVTLRGLRER